MKVLTIKQPWASLIAEGIKKYEFRTWKTKYRGDLLIHAGKGVDKKAINEYKSLDFPSGCIIAKANITDCIKVDDEFRNKHKEKVYSNVINDKTFDGYAFKLENVQKIKPIKTDGKLSLWEYEGEINEIK